MPRNWAEIALIDTLLVLPDPEFCRIWPGMLPSLASLMYNLGVRVSGPTRQYGTRERHVVDKG